MFQLNNIDIQFPMGYCQWLHGHPFPDYVYDGFPILERSLLRHFIVIAIDRQHCIDVSVAQLLK